MIPRRGPQVVNSALLRRFVSLKVNAGSTHSSPARSKKFTSLVKAALATFGLPETMVQLVTSMVLVSQDGTWVMHG